MLNIEKLKSEKRIYCGSVKKTDDFLIDLDKLGYVWDAGDERTIDCRPYAASNGSITITLNHESKSILWMLDSNRNHLNIDELYYKPLITIQNKCCNIEEAKVLVKKYREISLHQLINNNITKITGFGNRNTCILCIKNDNSSESTDCDKCIYKVVTGNYCASGINEESYSKLLTIEKYDLHGKMDTILNRANHIESLIEKYEKMERESRAEVYTWARNNHDNLYYINGLGGIVQFTPTSTTGRDDLDAAIHISENEARQTVLYMQWKTIAAYVEGGKRYYSIGNGDAWEIGIYADNIEILNGMATILPTSVYFSTEENAERALKIFTEEKYREMLN